MIPALIFLAALGFAGFALLLASLCVKARDIIWPALLLISALVLAGSAGGLYTVEMVEKAAVHVGHAEFYLDGETHKRKWRWLRSCAPVQETIKTDFTPPPYPDFSKEPKP